MKRLYHGSISLFDEIDISEGRGYKDFGKGFYATAVPEHAERIAVRNKHIAERRRMILGKKQTVGTKPITAYRYNLLFDEETGHLSVKVFQEANSEWLRFIVKNRNSADSIHNYDIVIGPTADAETTTIINEYYDELEEHDYSEDICERVIKELKPENLPKQYFFRTEQAIRMLSFDKNKRQVVG